ncbi:hypothetical protein [Aurantiacibacter sediminis]|uniref:Pectate lyase superfamily protein domain-containing protein n=1 Tax=Aurantiacibacter sediminis TaxID=2793064 RepID=A0ABS0N1R8_9SPHN|nr:hypothetical protein [Aurantiacibacter sediminis]MBH5321250.1 hypothetical protein [Aurantiacibacter sediminis]
MAGFGFGFGSGARQRGFVGGEQLPALEPSAAWTGVAGSGFTSTPADPVRNTAKPVMRALVPPNQYFTDSQLIGVMAAANNQGTLLDNLGLRKVVVHCEGETVDIAAPSVQTFERYDGTIYRMLGWWAKLRKPAGRAGHANVYFEAVPQDPTMQSRVIGPMQFSPVDILHDWTATIASDGSGDFANVLEAVQAAKAANAQNPLCTFTQSGTYDISGGAPNYTGAGYLTFACADGVSVDFAKPGYTTDLAMQMRTRFDGLWFRGRSFTFDFAYVSELYHEAQVISPFASGRSHVFEGVRFTRSLTPDALIRKALPGGGVAWSVRGSPWFLECDIHKMQDPAMAASLFRGCTFRDGFHDVAYGAACMVGCTVEGWSSEAYRNPIPALQVQYNGAATAATVSLSGINGAGSRTLTIKEDGVATASLTVEASEAAYIADANYSVQNVVDWLSAQPGWSAMLNDNSRYAAVLTDGSAGYGAFTDLDAKAAPLQLFTAFDLHTDFYQKDAFNLAENVIIYGNSGVGIDAQMLMIGGNATRDWLFANNALDIAGATLDNPGGVTLRSQFSKPHSHVIFAHNSYPRQQLWLRTGGASIRGYDPDVYCLVANNALADLQWDIGGADADVTIADNHLHAGAIGTGDLGEAKSGDAASLFADHAGGDFAPAGDLVSIPATPSLPFDLSGRKRAAMAAKGAFA